MLPPMSEEIRAQFDAVPVYVLEMTMSAWKGKSDALRFLCDLDEDGRRELVKELHGDTSLEAASGRDAILARVASNRDAMMAQYEADRGEHNRMVLKKLEEKRLRREQERQQREAVERIEATVTSHATEMPPESTLYAHEYPASVTAGRDAMMAKYEAEWGERGERQRKKLEEKRLRREQERQQREAEEQKQGGDAGTSNEAIQRAQAHDEKMRKRREARMQKAEGTSNEATHGAQAHAAHDEKMRIRREARMQKREQNDNVVPLARK